MNFFFERILLQQKIKYFFYYKNKLKNELIIFYLWKKKVIQLLFFYQLGLIQKFKRKWEKSYFYFLRIIYYKLEMRCGLRNILDVVLLFLKIDKLLNE